MPEDIAKQFSKWPPPPTQTPADPPKLASRSRRQSVNAIRPVLEAYTGRQAAPTPAKRVIYLNAGCIQSLTVPRKSLPVESRSVATHLPSFI